MQMHRKALARLQEALQSIVTNFSKPTQRAKSQSRIGKTTNRLSTMPSLNKTLPKTVWQNSPHRQRFSEKNSVKSVWPSVRTMKTTKTYRRTSTMSKRTWRSSRQKWAIWVRLLETRALNFCRLPKTSSNSNFSWGRLPPLSVASEPRFPTR